jgi:hypothetical protein
MLQRYPVTYFLKLGTIFHCFYHSPFNYKPINWLTHQLGQSHPVLLIFQKPHLWAWWLGNQVFNTWSIWKDISYPNHNKHLNANSKSVEIL